MRTCEERIVLIRSATARKALAEAKRRGKAATNRYENSDGNPVHFEFVGVLDLLHLGPECEKDEVWYNIVQRKLPMERAVNILPKEADLSALRDEL